MVLSVQSDFSQKALESTGKVGGRMKRSGRSDWLSVTKANRFLFVCFFVDFVVFLVSWQHLTTFTPLHFTKQKITLLQKRKIVWTGNVCFQVLLFSFLFLKQGLSFHIGNRKKGNGHESADIQNSKFCDYRIFEKCMLVGWSVFLAGSAKGPFTAQECTVFFYQLCPLHARYQHTHTRWFCYPCEDHSFKNSVTKSK